MASTTRLLSSSALNENSNGAIVYTATNERAHMYRKRSGLAFKAVEETSFRVMLMSFLASVPSADEWFTQSIRPLARSCWHECKRGVRRTAEDFVVLEEALK